MFFHVEVERKEGTDMPVESLPDNLHLRPVTSDRHREQVSVKRLMK